MTTSGTCPVAFFSRGPTNNRGRSLSLHELRRRANTAAPVASSGIAGADWATRVDAARRARRGVGQCQARRNDGLWASTRRDGVAGRRLAAHRQGSRRLPQRAVPRRIGPPNSNTASASPSPRTGPSTITYLISRPPSRRATPSGSHPRRQRQVPICSRSTQRSMRPQRTNRLPTRLPRGGRGSTSSSPRSRTSRPAQRTPMRTS